MKKILSLLLFLLFFSLSACSQSGSNENVRNLTAVEFNDAVKNTEGILIDFRTPGEYESGYIENALLVDFTSPGFEENISKLDKDKTYFVYCRSGNRSSKAVNIMLEKGFKNIYHLKSGINDWNSNNLPLNK
jgi:phage shock protein E